MKDISKVLTGYSKLSDAGALTTAQSIVKGCSGNASFVFDDELTGLETLTTDYASRLSKVKTGTKQDKDNKNASKAKLLTGLKVICTEINRQQAGNYGVLESSGAPMWANAYQKKGGDNPSPLKLRTAPGVNATDLKVEIDPTVGFHDYGTVWAYTLAAGAVNDINLWKQVFETGHSATLTGLLPGTKYMIAAAHKGAKGTPLVWSASLNAYTKAG